MMKTYLVSALFAASLLVLSDASLAGLKGPQVNPEDCKLEPHPRHGPPFYYADIEQSYNQGSLRWRGILEIDSDDIIIINSVKQPVSPIPDLDLKCEYSLELDIQKEYTLLLYPIQIKGGKIPSLEVDEVNSIIKAFNNREPVYTRNGNLSWKVASVYTPSGRGKLVSVKPIKNGLINIEKGYGEERISTLYHLTFDNGYGGTLGLTLPATLSNIEELIE